IGDLLFDTFGRPDVLFSNMRKMKIDPADIRHIVISHDHWDHVAGLWPLLSLNNRVKVYVCPGFDDSFKDRVRAAGAELVESGHFLEIKKDLFTTGEIHGLYAGTQIYEQALVCRSQKGIVIITGCAHPGIVEIVKYVKKYFEQPVNLLIGGFHLKDTPVSRVKDIVEEIKNLGVDRIAPMHCTGRRAERLLKAAFKGNFLSVKEKRKYIIE
ncbi:MAG: MBL fold metallo-hydrolase, partial [Candidatus Omnitrophica bacterium]|nr:MBL fold metallo-hydrolase [Candidatus Omnitrophota bacterium]